MNDDNTSESRNKNLSDKSTKFHNLVFLIVYIYKKMRRHYPRITEVYHNLHPSQKRLRIKRIRSI